MEKTLDDIYKLLYRLGLPGTYHGFYQMASAIQIVLEKPDRLIYVTKWVYPDVAKRFGINWCAAERNLRSVRDFLWEKNRRGLEELAHRPLEQKISVANLLSALVFALRYETFPDAPLCVEEPADTQAPTDAQETPA